jgi:hypothetical protein
MLKTLRTQFGGLRDLFQSLSVGEARDQQDGE